MDGDAHINYQEGSLISDIDIIVVFVIGESDGWGCSYQLS